MTDLEKQLYEALEVAYAALFEHHCNMHELKIGEPCPICRPLDMGLLVAKAQQAYQAKSIADGDTTEDDWSLETMTQAETVAFMQPTVPGGV